MILILQSICAWPLLLEEEKLAVDALTDCRFLTIVTKEHHATYAEVQKSINNKAL